MFTAFINDGRRRGRRVILWWGCVIGISTDIERCGRSEEMINVVSIKGTRKSEKEKKKKYGK